MKKSLFITGATGFIGTNLLGRIKLEEYKGIFCLGRTENNLIRKLSQNNNFKFIKADISESKSYLDYLKVSDIVVHLAAVTGKAKKDEYFKVNSEGTRILLQHCMKNNIKHFLFISSIAAGFTNIEGYHYAKSKIEAEESIKKSGITYTILRPTIVLGKDSPVLKSLLKLAKMPIVPIFGNGTALIQPIYVDDLIRYILEIIENDLFHNQTITVGGPEQTTIENFIRVLHKFSCENNIKLVHLPVRPIVKTLLLLEKIFLPLLPFTAGQLASFTNDGITDRNFYFERNGSRMMNIKEMIKLSLSTSDRTGEAPSNISLKKECAIYTKYLINRSPDEYIQEKYIVGHEIMGLNENVSRFDAILIKASLSNRFFLKLADVYTSLFYRKACLRRKLLLLLAILECCETTYSQIDTITECSRGILFIKAGQKAVVYLTTFLISIILFFPIKLYTVLKKDFKKPA